jgi:hypothetical protein
MPVIPSAPTSPSAPAQSFFPVASLTPKFLSNIAVTQSPITLSTQRQDWGAQLMQFSVGLAKMTRAKGMAVIAALLAAQKTPMMFGPTGAERYPQGTASTIADPTATPITVAANATAGANSVSIATPLLSSTVFKAMDYVQLGNNLHICTADVTTDTGGNATLNLFPTLRANANVGDIVTFNAPQGQFYAIGNVTQWQRDLGDIYTFGFDIVEAF